MDLRSLLEFVLSLAQEVIVFFVIINIIIKIRIQKFSIID